MQLRRDSSALRFFLQSAKPNDLSSTIKEISSVKVVFTSYFLLQSRYYRPISIKIPIKFYSFLQFIDEIFSKFVYIGKNLKKQFSVIKWNTTNICIYISSKALKQNCITCTTVSVVNHMITKLYWKVYILYCTY